MKRKTSRAISAKLRKALLVGSSKLDDFTAMLEKLRDFLATVDPKTLKEFERRLKIATNEEQFIDAMKQVEGLSLRQIMLLGKMMQLPGKRGRRDGTGHPDDEVVTIAKGRIAEGEDQGKVIADLAPKIESNSLDAAKRRLRRKLSGSAIATRGQIDN